MRVTPVVVLTTRIRSSQPPVVAAAPVLRSFQRTVTAPPDWSEAWATARLVTLRSTACTVADAMKTSATGSPAVPSVFWSIWLSAASRMSGPTARR